MPNDPDDTNYLLFWLGDAHYDPETSDARASFPPEALEKTLREFLTQPDAQAATFFEFSRTFFERAVPGALVESAVQSLVLLLIDTRDFRRLHEWKTLEPAHPFGQTMAFHYWLRTVHLPYEPRFQLYLPYMAEDVRRHEHTALDRALSQIAPSARTAVVEHFFNGEPLTNAWSHYSLSATLAILRPLVARELQGMQPTAARESGALYRATMHVLDRDAHDAESKIEADFLDATARTFADTSALLQRAQTAADEISALLKEGL